MEFQELWRAKQLQESESIMYKPENVCKMCVSFGNLRNLVQEFTLILCLQEPSTQQDPQYMFLRERLKALRDGWQELHQMWENRQQLLSQSLNLQMFNRDARQAEVLLSQQEHVLSKDDTPVRKVHLGRQRTWVVETL